MFEQIARKQGKSQQILHDLEWIQLERLKEQATNGIYDIISTLRKL